MKDVHVVGKKMARNGHKWPFMSHKFSLFFLQNCKKLEAKEMFYVIAIDLIKIIKTLEASQNDCQILIFVKAIYVAGEKITRSSGKIVKS